MMNLLYIVILFALIQVNYSWNFAKMKACFTNRMTMSTNDGIAPPLSETAPQLTSRKIEKLTKDIDDLNQQFVSLEVTRKQDEETLKQLNDEFGSEIERVKKEFHRIKERAYEESKELTKLAKVDAVKEILPVTDNFMRAKKIYDSLETENEKKIMSEYEIIFSSLNSILEEFGATRVVSVGQPFDYTFMEAIMAAPSTEYPADVVTTEYQVGYKMDDKIIRPAVVAVSTGPGP